MQGHARHLLHQPVRPQLPVASPLSVLNRPPREPVRVPVVASTVNLQQSRKPNTESAMDTDMKEVHPKPVVPNLFHIFYPFTEQDYQIYPQYTQWCSFIQNTKLKNWYSLE